MFTLNQANEFLTTQLKFSDWKQVFERNKLDFLRLFVRKHVTHICYQNITISSVVPEERHSPTNEEIIADGISGNGGTCISLNHFAKVVLDAIGFDTFEIEGDSPLNPFPGDHIMVVVNLSGEQYLVDVGFMPIYDVIPLNPTKMPYRAVMYGFPYEFRYCIETDTYYRYHLVGGCNNGRFKNKDEQEFLVFKLIPKKLEYFIENMTPLYCDPTSFILRVFYLTRFLEISDEEMRKESANPGFVIIQGLKLIEGDVNSRKETVFETHDQIVPSVMKYFPNSDPRDVKMAIETYIQFQNGQNIN